MYLCKAFSFVSDLYCWYKGASNWSKGLIVRTPCRYPPPHFVPVHDLNIVGPFPPSLPPSSFHLLTPSLPTLSLHRPLIDRSSSVESTSVSLQVNQFDDPEFSSLVRVAEDAILSGIHPQMISQGSSGSYFIRNTDSVSVASLHACMCVGG